jgi:hypothetical protein
LRGICDEYVHGDIHFLKIDVEGAEKSVLQGCDFNRFRPWLLVVEATLPTTQTPCYEEWEDLVLGAGYEFALFHEVNRYYVARERLGLKRLIQQPESTTSVQRRKTPSPRLAIQSLPGGLSEDSRHELFSARPALPRGPFQLGGSRLASKLKPLLPLARREYLLAKEGGPCATAIFAYVIALVGLVMIAVGAWTILCCAKED